ncbi:hypothetical protein R5R35_009700 [Gryllus longicercus]|uniref:Uncharacterized protein n=1 Tax=Gryllus longicercus TaxID=2509291 RepID=A0AAN9VHS5_9ORTH
MVLLKGYDRITRVAIRIRLTRKSRSSREFETSRVPGWVTGWELGDLTAPRSFALSGHIMAKHKYKMGEPHHFSTLSPSFSMHFVQRYTRVRTSSRVCSRLPGEPLIHRCLNFIMGGKSSIS